jgi:hypothetical protein
MSTTTQHTPKFLRQRKFFLFLPVLVLPFLFFAFYSMGGGGGEKKGIATGPGMGFNMELPKPLFAKERTPLNKMEVYKKADQDSIKKRELQQQDPYHIAAKQSATGMSGNVLPVTPSFPSQDQKADELLKKLDQLRQSIQQPVIPSSSSAAIAGNTRTPAGNEPAIRDTPAITRLQHTLPSIRPHENNAEDPQLQRLNTMLDKIIRIQHPREELSPEADAIGEKGEIPDNIRNMELIPADSAASNAIPAAVSEDQTLVAGATIALRLIADARIGGIKIPKDQLVYGVVSIKNDRMLITISSIRREQSIFSTTLQVYDMDGLPGIHIPGAMNREVAKQSADQGISSINLATFDPSIGAQAANASIQAAKSLFSRKVKLIRVAVRAGYQVLLYNPKASPFAKMINKHAETHVDSPATTIILPDELELKTFLHHTTTSEKLSLTLQGIFLKQNMLWFSLLLDNESPIEYTPAYTRWFIRDRHQFKRTAIQELPVVPVYVTPAAIIPGDSNRSLLMGFQPFALPKDKELVLQIGERNGARVLTMAIGHKEILKAKK